MILIRYILPFVSYICYWNLPQMFQILSRFFHVGLMTHEHLAFEHFHYHSELTIFICFLYLATLNLFLNWFLLFGIVKIKYFCNIWESFFKKYFSKLWLKDLPQKLYLKASGRRKINNGIDYFFKFHFWDYAIINIKHLSLVNSDLGDA